MTTRIVHEIFVPALLGSAVGVIAGLVSGNEGLFGIFFGMMVGEALVYVQVWNAVRILDRSDA